MDDQHPAVTLTSQVTRLLDAAAGMDLDRQPCLIKVSSGYVGPSV